MPPGGWRTDRQKAYASGNFSKLRGGGARITIHGHKEVQAVLEELASTHGTSVERALGKRALRAMLRPVAAAIKREAPTRSRYRTTGKRKKRAARINIKKFVGHRLSRNKRKGIYEAKAGLNVKKSGGKQFRQAHLYTIGTQRRSTRSGLNRGSMGSDNFVIRARQNSTAAATLAGLQAVQKGLPIEVEKVRKRHAAKAARSGN